MLKRIKDSRTFWVTASLVTGFLQAWDSGALQAEGLVQVLIVAGIVMPAAAIALAVGQGIRIVSLVVAALVLVAARMMSATSLNTLHLALFVPALYILFLSGLQSAIQRRTEA